MPEPEFPLNALFKIITGIYTNSARDAFRQFKTNLLYTDIMGDLKNYKIEDRVVDKSNAELNYLENLLDQKQSELVSIHDDISLKKNKAVMNKTSDMAMITFLKGMNELREIEVQKNMVDYILYKFNKDNWLSELVVAFHITNNSKAIESFSED